MVIAVVAIVVLAAAAWALTRGDDDPSEQLRALQDDAMGRFEPTGGRLAATVARSEKESGLLGKPAQAKYTRLFELPAATARGALRDALAAARAAGWQLATVRRGLGATGDRRLPTGRVILTISLAEDGTVLPDDLTPPVLSIGLTHGGP